MDGHMKLENMLNEMKKSVKGDFLENLPSEPKIIKDFNEDVVGYKEINKEINAPETAESLKKIENLLNERPELLEFMQIITDIKNESRKQITIDAVTTILYRLKLFNKVVMTITEIADINIKDSDGNLEGVGANLIYDDYINKDVSFIHIIKDDTLELRINDEVIMKIYKTSPILEAFKELFEQMQEDCK